MKVKTFACPIKIFKAKGELDELDKMVNKFIDENKENWKSVRVFDSFIK